MRKKQVFKKSPIFALLSVLVPVLFTVAVAAAVITGINQAEQSSRAEGERILAEGIRRAVLTCYAVEGFYPESIAYIERHYGVFVDKTKYVVHYNIFASNIMPGISVFEYNRAAP